jgi:hypothetical protein
MTKAPPASLASAKLPKRLANSPLKKAQRKDPQREVREQETHGLLEKMLS